MNIKYKLLLITLLVINFLDAQIFYRKINQKYLPEKISIKDISEDKITISVHYVSSDKCMCESEEDIIINKNSEGKFKYLLSDSENDFILINFLNNKINSVSVKNSNNIDCCSVYEGTYLIKPVKKSKKN